MNRLLTGLTLALATWRVTSLLSSERGPDHIFELIREAAGIEHNDEGAVTSYPDTFWAELLVCNWCLSVWVGAALALLYRIWPGAGRAVAIPLALSAGSIAIDKVIRNG